MSTKKGKGVSKEEKLKRVLDVFKESQDVFSIKCVEKGASKKGINTMLVKDLVKELVDNGDVDAEKIGTSTYYWAFTSKIANNKNQMFDELKRKFDDATKRKGQLQEQLKQLESSDEDAAKRVKAEEALTELKTLQEKLTKEVEQYKDCDPDLLNKYKEDIEVAREAVDRWTDNVFNIRKWIINNSSVNEKTLNKQFGISEDLDYWNE